MNKKIIKEKIREILHQRLGLDIAGFKDSLKLDNDLGIDSFDALRIIFELEDAFNIKVAPAETKNIRTVKDICNYINSRITDHK